MDIRQPPMTLANGRKRRRVPRACDECRQNKVKCDGKQPCLLCISHEFECTYNRPSCRNRKFPATSAEAIENRLRQIETTLNAVVDRGLVESSIAQSGQDDAKASTANHETQKSSPVENDRLEVTLDASGRLDIDDDGRHNFHGHSSGFAFLAQIRQKYEDLLSPAVEPDNTAKSQPDLPQIFDSRQSFGIPVALVPPTLPSKTVAKELVESALECVCALSRVVHRPTFDSMFNRVYDLGVTEHGAEELRFLPLLYAVMAVGCYGSLINNDKNESKRAMAAGVQFFLAAKQMTDITECQDITSLQAIVFIVAFLQCSSRMSACYTYLGIAMKSAIRMGLHRHVEARFTPVEQQTRRRIFWVIRKMDIYVSTMLGLPGSIAENDIDQELPLDIDDSYVLEDRIVPQPLGQFAPVAATNAHIRLMGVLKKITTFIYPIKGAEQRIAGNSRVYFVDHSRIHEIEIDLRTWLDELPGPLKTPIQISERLAGCLLRTSYYHVRLLLYRPFTHHLSDADISRCPQDQPQTAAAAACLSAAKHIVHITKEMKHGNLLAPGHWFALYATFFAVFSLVYFVLENPSDARAPAVFEDAKLGRELLVSFHDRSPIAERCSVSLKTLFDRLPDTLARRLRETSLQTRQGGSPNSTGSSPEYGLTISNDYFQTEGSPGKHCDNQMHQTPGIAAAMPISLNFTTGSAPQPVGSSFHIHPGGGFPNALGRAVNVGTRTLNQGHQGFRFRGSESKHLANPSTTASHWTESLTTPNQTVAGLTPHLHYPDGARLPAEDGVTLPSNTQIVDGLADTETSSTEPVLAEIDFGTPEQDSCGESWNSYGLGDGLLQATGGTDINLAYFFNEHEWKELEMDGFGGL